MIVHFVQKIYCATKIQKIVKSTILQIDLIIFVDKSLYLRALNVNNQNPKYLYMNKFLLRLPQLGLLALLCGIMLGCKPEADNAFSVKVAGVGPEYVEINVTAPNPVQIAYIVDTKEQLMNNPAVMFTKGEVITVRPDDTFRVSGGLHEKTKYWLYLVAKLDAQNYSEIYTIPFTTTEYDFDELLTVTEQAYDGYNMRITVPEETLDRKNAIRYNQCCIMMYNYMSGSDDYSSLLYNGGRYVTESTTLRYSEDTNWHETGSDSDGDGEVDYDTYYNPISPGEPVVFVAGEFSWMEDTPEYGNKYFGFPAGWESGYYMPLIDTAYYAKGRNVQNSMGVITDVDMSRPLDDYWTGAFQRKHFRIREPELLDAGVEVKLADASPIDLTLEFWPDDEVQQYAFGIFDDAMYSQILEILNGNEDYMQWMVTSYFAAYTFGTKVASGPVQAKLTSFYYQDAIKETTDYHVLVTAMGNSAATEQSFQKFTFSTTAKVLDEPEIVVTTVEDEITPYEAVYNIKCTSALKGVPVTECYYAANYLRDWLLSINGGSTYFGIVTGNKAYSYFTSDELEEINSEEGLTIRIPSIDGETTRLVVVGYNEEYTPNDLNYEFIEQCPAVADCTTPFTDPKPYVDEDLYLDLAGDWTATAVLTDSEGTKTFEHSSKITLAADLYDYPESLSEEVYEIYAKAGDEGKDREEVDAMWYEFKQLAKRITEARLQDQNRLVGIGWLDADSYGRLDARTPYDLFVATDYNSVDVSSLYNDYGPKWYLETSKDADGNVVYSIPIDANFLPPAANWSVPFYLGAREKDNYWTITYGEGWTPSFPVTVSADRNTITIHPLVHQDVNYYPNMIGMDYMMQQALLENPVVSEVVLTRGWTEPSGNVQSSVRRSGGNVQVKATFPAGVHKKMTDVSSSVELQKMEYEMVSPEQFKERADRLVENTFKIQNK